MILESLSTQNYFWIMSDLITAINLLKDLIRLPSFPSKKIEPLTGLGMV